MGSIAFGWSIERESKSESVYGSGDGAVRRPIPQFLLHTPFDAQTYPLLGILGSAVVLCTGFIGALHWPLGPSPPVSIRLPSIANPIVTHSNYLPTTPVHVTAYFTTSHPDVRFNKRRRTQLLREEAK